jgi:hypothetical protein
MMNSDSAPGTFSGSAAPDLSLPVLPSGVSGSIPGSRCFQELHDIRASEMSEAWLPG